jgi:uncharacterized membrane protein (UPF0127 family)
MNEAIRKWTPRFQLTMTRYIHVLNKNRIIESPPLILFCDTFMRQLQGFTFHPRLSLDEGLILVGKRDSRLDSSIHMFFVSFDLGVIWINAEMKVVDKIIAKSWRPAYFARQPAKYVLEIHPSHLDDYQTGDIVEFHNA